MSVRASIVALIALSSALVTLAAAIDGEVLITHAKGARRKRHAGRTLRAIHED